MGFLRGLSRLELLTSLKRRKINFKLIEATDEFTSVLDQYSFILTQNQTAMLLQMYCFIQRLTVLEACPLAEGGTGLETRFFWSITRFT